MRRKSSFTLSIGILAIAGVAAAQDQAPHPWRAADDPPPADVSADQGQASVQAQAPQAPADQPQNQGFPAGPQTAPPQQGPQLPSNYGPGYAPTPAVPQQLTIKQGTYAMVRTNDWLSSD